MDLLFESNRLASELANEFRKVLLSESTNDNRTIVAYSGHFQPFHAGHYKIYRTLVKKFGRDNVYITTTNQQDELENPISFEDKKRIATSMFDIEDGKFQEVKNPFVPIELLKKFDPASTSLVTVISTDDADVISKSKYFHKYVDGEKLRPYTEAGYYLTIPELTLSINNRNLTTPQIMQILGSPKTSDGVKSKIFKDLYGSENKEILDLISKRAEPAASDIDGEFDKTTAFGQVNKTTPGKTDATGQTNEPDDESDDDKTPPMQRMIVNPDTGREIKVQSALKYPRWKPVYKKAEKVLKSAGIDRKDRVKEPEVNTRYKKRAQNMNKEDLIAYLGQVLFEQLRSITDINDVTLTVPGLGEVHLRIDDSFPQGLKAESDQTPAPVAIYAGRFQPYHAGHQHAYEDLVNKFGKNNVYIATSDKTESGKSPFNFDDKKNIITKMFGIDPSHVVKVTNPYKAEEITSHLPPNTPVVWGLGEKDMERLNKSKYFKPYSSDAPPTDGYRDHGYVYEVPQLPMKINGKTISGTVIRNVFAGGTPSAKEALFKRLYGKSDAQIFDLISNRVRQGPDTPEKQVTKSQSSEPETSDRKASMQSKLKDKIKNPETDNIIQIDTALKYDKNHPAHKAARKYLQSKSEALHEELLMEGGAYGHLLHPYEDLDLTFADLRQMVQRALGTGLDAEGPVTEKTDGQNIMFTVRDGQVKFARSKKHVKNRGEEAMTPDELKQKFTGRGSIEKTFGTAGDDLQAAVEKMSPEEVNSIFGDGRKFMSVEVIHPESENVIPYGKNMLVLHHTIEFDDEGNPQGHNTEDSDKMVSALRNVEADKQKEFGIRGQQFVVLSDAEEEKMKQKLNSYNSELDKFQQINGLTDESTIREYKQKWWMDKLNRMDTPLSDSDKIALISRWVDGDKSVRLTSFSTPAAQAWAKKADVQAKDIDNKIIYPIQSLVARVGVDALNRSSELLSAANPQAGQIIKDKLAQALQTIHQSGNQDKISEIDRFMKLIDDIGLEKIAPSEGLLFTFNGKLYKLTGAFAPINRIIGSIKYDEKMQSAPSGDKLKVYLDDIRPKPEGFDVQVKTAKDAIDLLKTGRVSDISFDHDLGPEEAGTGYDVAKWIEQQAHINPNFVSPRWQVHSANPVGRNNIVNAMNSAERATGGVVTKEPQTKPSDDKKIRTTIDPKILSTKVHNPETDNDILVKTALKYDKKHPARKSAEKVVRNNKK